MRQLLPRKYMLCVLVLCLAGCGRSERAPKDLKEYIQGLQKTILRQVKPKKIKALNPDSAKYEVDTTRSPFVAYISRGSSRRLTPLEKFPLDELVLVGIMGYGDNNSAVFKAPNGKVYNVGIGSYLGQSNGKIVDITKTRVTVTEQVASEFGRVVTRSVAIRVGQRKGKGEANESKTETA